MFRISKLKMYFFSFCDKNITFWPPKKASIEIRSTLLFYKFQKLWFWENCIALSLLGTYTAIIDCTVFHNKGFSGPDISLRPIQIFYLISSQHYSTCEMVFFLTSHCDLLEKSATSELNRRYTLAFFRSYSQPSMLPSFYILSWDIRFHLCETLHGPLHSTSTLMHDLSNRCQTDGI